ncbi:MAG: glycine/sarcosine/betaine reductase selenoprotein B family protein [Actinomycetota bacterium]
MVRLSDLHPTEADHLRARAAAMPALECERWLSPPPLPEATVAIVSTCGMHRRDDPPFTPGALDYRLIPRGVDWGDVVVSHISANFDRSGLADDPNVAMPLDRLEDLAAAGEIGGVSQWHYTFMGAHPRPQMFEDTGTEVGRLLAEDGVDVALLVPI